MSVLDDLQGLEQHVAKRLAELEPLAAEYEELKKVANRLGVRPASTSGQTPTRRRSASASSRRSAANPTSERGRRAAGRKRAAGSRNQNGSSSRGAKRRDAVVAAVKKRPGITVAELGSELGVDPTGLYRVVGRLEADGVLRKAGRTLQPVG